MAVVLISDTNPAEFVSSLNIKGHAVEVHRFAQAPLGVDSCQAGLILLDCEANVKSGLKKLREIKKFCPSIPVIFITAESSEEIIIEAFRLGAKDFFKKPINTIQLKKTIANLLKIRDKSSEKRTPYLVSSSQSSSLYAKINTAIPDNLLKAIAFMEDNLAEEIDLETLAQKAGMSKHHFSRVFKTHLDMSPMQFLAYLRLERAKWVLKCTAHSITAVANEVGYNDLSNFNRSFKKFYGISPTAYRKAITTKKQQPLKKN